MAGRKKESKNSTGQSILHLAAMWLFYVSTIAVPLYMKNGYFGLIGAKSRMYLLLACPALLAAGITILILRLSERQLNHTAGSRSTDIRKTVKEREKGKAEEKGKGKGKVNWPAVLLLSISGWWLFSSALSDDPMASLLGDGGWGVGSLVILAFVLSAFVMAAYLDFIPNLLLPVMTVNVVIFLFAAIQAAGVDLFGLHERIDPAEYFSYISTIGQKNSFSGYLCLLLPLFWGFYLACTEQLTEILFGMLSALGILCVVICESDSVYVGSVFCLIFLFPFILSSAEHTKRASVLLIFYGAALLLTRRAPFYARKAAALRDISAFMVRSFMPFAVILAGVLIWFLADRWMEGWTEKQRRILLILVEGVLLAGVAGAAIYSMINFSDSWGNRRGMIWRMGWEQFWEQPILRRLVGVGPDHLRSFYSEVSIIRENNVLSAHCEPLQVLFTTGIIGEILYLFFWGSVIASWFRRKLWKDGRSVFFVPLMGYLGQSFFCTMYPVTGVLLSAVTGLYLSQCRPDREEEQNKKKEKEKETGRK